MSEQKEFDSVWDAIEDDSVERKNLKLRSGLMRDIVSRLECCEYSMTELATILKTKKWRISDLKQGKINDFSLDTLINFALRLRLRVSVSCS